MKNIALIKSMEEQNIGYFSSSLFAGSKAIISHCNNHEWLQQYQKHYGSVIPPVQKYLLSSKSPVILWDAISLDQEAKEYIEARNDITKIQHYITILFKYDSHLSTYTFGSEKGAEELTDYCKKNLQIIRSMDHQIASYVLQASSALL